MVTKLLSDGGSNAKQVKASGGLEVRILYLTPGPDVCPWSVRNGCLATCLHFQGRYKMFPKIGLARERKHKLFREDRPEFMRLLHKELAALVLKADRDGTQAVARLDGTSDLGLALDLHPRYPRIMFYDYTKGLARVSRWSREREKGLAENYHLTFSLGAGNMDEAREAISLGANVAVAFNVGKGKPLPERFTIGRHDYKVIDGDVNDWRWRDPWPRVVGLRAKGTSAKLDTEGFFQEV